MKVSIIIISITVLGVWFLTLLYLLGVLPEIGFIAPLDELTKPKATHELGDSLGLVNGLFSGLAVVLALIAVLFQGKELKASTVAQKDQAKALILQIYYQSESIRLNALSVRLQYLLSEIERMDRILADISGDRSKEPLFENCAEKKTSFIKEAKRIDLEMNELLLSLSRKSLDSI